MDATTKKIKYFYWIDCLRGVAALAVLVWHYQHFYFIKTANALANRSSQPFYEVLNIFYNYGRHAVFLFWVISGFVFSTVYIKSKRTSSKSFFVHRLARLYPLHFLTLIAVLVLQLISLRLTGGYQIYGINDAYHFILNLFFVSNWGLEKGYSFNGPIWSVSIEVLIYFFFFMTLPIVIKRGITAVLFFIVFFGLGVKALIPQSSIWQCGLYFYLGCLSFYVWRIFRVYTVVLMILSALSLAASVIIVYIKPGLIESTIQFVLMLPPIVLMAALMDAKDEGRIGSYFKGFGDLTYSIYLWHIPIQIAVLTFFDYKALNRNIFSTGSFFLSFVISVLLIAYFSFHFYELPMRNWVRGFDRES